jgi:alcohol dehydrogenase
MTMASSTWNYPTTVRIGPGRSSEVADACRTVGVDRPLVVTDAGLVGSPMVESVVARLRDAGLVPGVFSDIKPNPVGANVEAGCRTLRDGDHDGVVAIGGGSALDIGKVLALVARQSRPWIDFEDVGDNWTRADASLIVPVIALPTTAGTGSEVGRAGVVTDERTHTKRIVFHPRMLPAVVICDPELTVGLPRVLTVGTGLDALSHALEAYCAPGYHPMADGIAVEAVRLVVGNLETAATRPDDIEARQNMLTAAAMGATAFQKGLGAMHALAHPIGAMYDTHHGMTNAVLMPYVLAFNSRAIDERMARLSAYVGMEGGADGFMRWLLDVRDRLDVPATLADLGVPLEGCDTVARAAVVDPSAATNPIALTVDDCATIFRAAWNGRL